ncbi:MAG: DNA-formamidopyrimidine glycosylase [Candidatus Onthovivens sp.]|nr:DNA-formamidopyrimidine glycosylase [Candidatus Onthovivens sp.]
MPELPEVETVINTIRPHIINKEIEKIEVYYDRLIQSNLDEFKTKLINQKFINVTRYGKFIFLHLTNDFVIITHLRMEGKFRFENSHNLRKKHTSAGFFFKDGTSLAFDDTRKFGLMYLSDEANFKETKMIKKLGIEANKISENDYEFLIKKFKKNKCIKELLLDQSILAGIGNIYADEILFSTKINPFRKGNDISDEKYHEIFQASNQILNKAITLGGSTIHSFHPSEGVDGKFQETLLCYGKSGTPCPNCNTTLHKDFIGGRGTTFCPNCQIDKSLEKGIAITGPIGSGKSTVLNYFKENGFITYSCDEMVHKLYEKPEISRKISQILNAPFDINNKKTTKLARKIMIDNPEIKKKIESYIYPILEKEMVLIIKNNEKPVFEVPTLFKAHLEYLFKTIIVIEISKEQQIKNLENRNDDINSSINLNRDYEIKKYQDKIKIVKADGNFNNLYAQIDEIIKSI